MAQSRFEKFAPCSDEQRTAVDAIDQNDLTFLVGPAGVGKSAIAAAKASEWLRRNKKGHIIIARPAVGAGEKLGYLPGTEDEKIEPYLRPILRLLEEHAGDDAFKQRMSREEFIVLSTFEHMRGNTYDNAFVIVDEAQNATCEQMKMVLTRLGSGSKMVVTGDPDQCDIKGKSGIVDAIEKLCDVSEIGIVFLTHELSNHRHPLVSKILTAYRASPPNAMSLSKMFQSHDAESRG